MYGLYYSSMIGVIILMKPFVWITSYPAFLLDDHLSCRTDPLQIILIQGHRNTPSGGTVRTPFLH